MADAQSERDEALQEVDRLEAKSETLATQQQMTQKQTAAEEQYRQQQTDLIRHQEQLSATQQENARIREELRTLTRNVATAEVEVTGHQREHCPG